MSVIRFRRGMRANLPALTVGEPALCTDTGEVYIGTAGGNVRVPQGGVIELARGAARVPVTGWTAAGAGLYAYSLPVAAAGADTDIDVIVTGERMGDAPLVGCAPGVGVATLYAARVPDAAFDVTVIVRRATGVPGMGTGTGGTVGGDLDVVYELTAPVTGTGHIAKVDGCVKGLGLEITAACVAAQEGAGEASPDNVRRMAGKTAVNVWRGSGKNLGDTSRRHSTSSATSEVIATGIRVTSTSDTATNPYARYIMPPIPAGQTVTLSANMFASGVNNPALYLTWANASGTSVETIINMQGTGAKLMMRTLTSRPEGTAYLMLVAYGSRNQAVSVGDYAEFANLQLEIGPAATAYEPYVGNAYTVTFPAGVELFGLQGVEDEVRSGGAGTKKTQMLSFAGTENLLYAASQSSDSTLARYVMNVAGIKPGGIGAASHFPWYRSALVSNPESLSVSSSAAQIYMAIKKTRLTGWQDAWTDAEKNNALKAYLAAQNAAGTPVQLLYELAAAQAITIPKLEIPALQGKNTVMTDAGGETTVTGRMGAAGLLSRIAALEKITAGL